MDDGMGGGGDAGGGAEGDRAEGGAGAGAGVQPAARAQAAGVDGARRIKTCTYQKYKKVERSLCVYIRGAEAEPGEGLRQADVVEWYLNQQEDIASVEDLASERRLVKQIIQRLATADKVLLPVPAPESADAPESDGLRPHDARYLTVRPHVEL